MKNKRLYKYSRLTNLQEIEEEKARLKKVIKKQGNLVENDWDEIYNFWSFVPKVTRSVTHAVKSIPFGVNVMNFVRDVVMTKRVKKSE